VSSRGGRVSSGGGRESSGGGRPDTSARYFWKVQLQLKHTRYAVRDSQNPWQNSVVLAVRVAVKLQYSNIRSHLSGRT
jgi:hypothetical protein